MTTDDMTIIDAGDGWLELREGEKALFRGRLDAPLTPGGEALIARDEAWRTLLVDLREGYDGEAMPTGTRVSVIVERHEDGVGARWRDIRREKE